MPDKKTDVRRVNRFVFVAVIILLVACSQDNGEEPASTAATSVSEASPAPAPELIAGPELPDPADALAGLISICTIPNPEVPSSAFTIFNAEPNARNDYWVRYECKETCTEWQQCLAPAYLNDKGEPIMHGRHPELPKKALLSSTGHRNTSLKFICGRTEIQSFPGPLVQAQCYLVQL